MKVTGFTFIRNALKYNFPVLESIRSILPVCDDFIVTVGNSDDDTLNLIKSISSPKIRIIETVWNDSLRTGGRVLALETDKAFKAISSDTDWCFYIQADEVVHERYLNNIRDAMLRHKDDTQVDGLLFKYLHFYGSYDYCNINPSWYKNEIRIIRNSKNIFSYRDAQGFRKGENEKLVVTEIDAFVYHYGYVKEPKAMQRKQEHFGKLWHTDDWMKKNIPVAAAFDYKKSTEPLRRFNDTHPQIMQERIDRKNWAFDPDVSSLRLSTKQKLKMFLEQKAGLNLSYKNYKLL